MGDSRDTYDGAENFGPAIKIGPFVGAFYRVHKRPKFPWKYAMIGGTAVPYCPFEAVFVPRGKMRQHENQCPLWTGNQREDFDIETVEVADGELVDEDLPAIESGEE